MKKFADDKRSSLFCRRDNRAQLYKAYYGRNFEASPQVSIFKKSFSSSLKFRTSKLETFSLASLLTLPNIWKITQTCKMTQQYKIVARRIIKRTKFTAQSSKNLEPPNIIYNPFDWHSTCSIYLVYLKYSGVLWQRSFLNPHHFLFSPMLCLSLC